MNFYPVPRATTTRFEIPARTANTRPSLSSSPPAPPHLPRSNSTVTVTLHSTFPPRAHLRRAAGLQTDCEGDTSRNCHRRGQGPDPRRSYQRATRLVQEAGGDTARRVGALGGTSLHLYCTVEFAQLTGFITAAVRSMFARAGLLQLRKPSRSHIPAHGLHTPHSLEPTMALHAPAQRGAGSTGPSPPRSVVGSSALRPKRTNPVPTSCVFRRPRVAADRHRLHLHTLADMPYATRCEQTERN